jgi:5-methyltetrahydrofolate corrinoid/iron sulfur protein methyltransferase
LTRSTFHAIFLSYYFFEGPITFRQLQPHVVGGKTIIENQERRMLMSQKVLGIAESINIMGKRSGTAMKERNQGPVQEMAKEEAAAGASYLDLNIGPARKDGEELMPWVVETVQAVTDVPLVLDTTNVAAMAAGFKAVTNKSDAILNSIMARPERMEALIPVAAEMGCNVVALLWGPDGLPRDSNERAALAVDLMMGLAEGGIPNEKMLFDPIASPITLGADQTLAGLEFLSMLQDIAPGAGSTIGLSNVSNGVAEHLRKYLDRTYLIMLMKYGITTAIVNSYDKELMAICKGERQEHVDMVHGMMDGNDPDPTGLEGTALEHYKTYKVLSGQTVFSESWLEL